MMEKEVFIRNKKAFSKLKEIIENGYLPRRYLCHYGDDTRNLTNGLGHCMFNLTDPLLKKFTLEDRGIFCLGLHMGEFTAENVEYHFIENAKLYGLTAVECRKNDMTDKRSWKVAIFSDEFGSDCHFLKEERNGIWTGKLGFYQDLSLYPALPRNIETRNHEYTLGKVLMLSNPKGLEPLDQIFNQKMGIENV